MLTLTGNTGFTIMVIVLEVSGLLVTQVVREDVKIHRTTSPFDGV